MLSIDLWSLNFNHVGQSPIASCDVSSFLINTTNQMWKFIFILEWHFLKFKLMLSTDLRSRNFNRVGQSPIASCDVSYFLINTSNQMWKFISILEWHFIKFKLIISTLSLSILSFFNSGFVPNYFIKNIHVCS